MLYVSFGVEKGGSTYTYFTIKAALEAAGHAHIQLEGDGRLAERTVTHGVNNINEWTPSVLALADAAIPADRIVALRTHAQPDAAVLEAIDAGRALLGLAVRDPRDVALSMLDVAGVRANMKHRDHWIRVEPGNLESALPAVKRTVDRALAWMRPGATVFYYEETAFQPEKALERLCAQLGLPGFSRAESEAIIDKASTNPRGKRNVAEPVRHAREMSAADQRRVLDHFAEFYACFMPEADVAIEGTSSVQGASIEEPAMPDGPLSTAGAHLLDEEIAQLLPPGNHTLLIAPALGEIDERLAAGREVTQLGLIDGAVPGLEAALSAPNLDAVALRCGLEALVDPEALMRACAERGLPLVCRWFRDPSVAGNFEGWADWRQSFDKDSFEALAMRAGYQPEASSQQRGFPAELLLPTDTLVNQAWWRGKEGKSFIGRRRKRVERELAQMAEGAGKPDWWSSPKWEDRSKFIARMIPEGLHVLDIGCGSMFLRDHLSGCTYIGLDQMAQNDDTIVVDLNRAPIPDEVLARVDLVTALGVFEYIQRPEAHFGRIAEAGKPILLTYNIAEGRKAGGDAQLTAWRNSFDTAALTRVLLESGFQLEALHDYDSKQRVFIGVPRKTERRPWWDRLGRTPASA